MRDLCSFMLTERNFAVKEKLFSARFVFFHVNREKFRGLRKIVECEISVFYHEQREILQLTKNS